jgi:pyruvate/2-oxoglutarate dehydrogenase complex dihydrolipoamide acyltransferase (E2) component
MYDVEDFIAIINPPGAAILAISSAREVPVVDNGLVKPGWRMKASISVDYRVSDGADIIPFRVGPHNSCTRSRKNVGTLRLGSWKIL